MTQFSQILVALDLGAMDAQLLQAAKIFGQKFKAEAVHFIHVVPTFVVPDNLESDLKNIFSPNFQIDSVIEKRINEAVSGVFGDETKIKKHILIREGSTAKVIEQTARDVRADLLLVGKKKMSSHSGVAAKMVARRVNAAVLFVTDMALPTFRRLLVPIDFSVNSQHALQTALDFRQIDPSVNVTALQVVDYPPTALYLTGQYGLLAPDWQQKLLAAFEHFTQKAGINSKTVLFDTIKNENFNVAEQIHAYARQIDADAIIMGAKGHSGLDDLFLGSVTEKVVAKEEDLPVLIVR